MAVFGHPAGAKGDRACSGGKIKLTRPEFLADCRVFGSRKRVVVEMTDHVSTSQMELFARTVLPEAETDSISEHLMTCEACHQLFVEALRRQKDSTALSFTTALESLLRHEHIEYEQLVGLPDNKLDATDREIIGNYLLDSRSRFC